MLYVLFIHELRHPDWLVLAVTAREYAILPLTVQPVQCQDLNLRSPHDGYYTHFFV